MVEQLRDTISCLIFKSVSTRYQRLPHMLIKTDTVIMYCEPFVKIYFACHRVTSNPASLLDNKS